MDRVVGSKASKTNSSTNNIQAQSHSTENKSASGLVIASGNLSRLASMAMLPAPRFPTVPTLYGASGNSQGETSLSTVCAENSMAEDLINDRLNNHTINHGTIRFLPDGYLTLDFPVNTTHSQLYSFLVFDLHSYDLSKVAELNLSFCTSLTGDSFKLLGEDLPSLRTLNLTGCSQLQDKDLGAFENMTHLEKLHLAGCSGIGEGGFKYLTSLLDNLQTLDLTNCPQVNDTFLTMLPNMVELKHLILSGCTGFTGDGLGKIGKVGQRSKLQTLTLNQCPQIADADLGKLRTLSQLQELNIKKCPSITKSGINKLSRYLKSTRFESDFTQNQENRPYGVTWQGILPPTKKTRFG